jgi:hypothetical protein
MTALDRLVPGPHLLEIDRIDLAAPAARVWERVRHGQLAQSLPIRALFAIRSIASGPHTSLAASSTFRIDDLKSTREHPGFEILVDEPPCEMAVAAIGKVWRLDIPFVHVANADEYAAFAQPGFIKVAWSIRVLPRGERQSHIELELRVEATDVRSWRKFRRYFHLIGPFSRAIRRSLLRALVRDLGPPDTRKERTLLGDDLLPDAGGQTTDTIVVLGLWRAERGMLGVPSPLPGRTPGSEVAASAGWWPLLDRPRDRNSCVGRTGSTLDVSSPRS